MQFLIIMTSCIHFLYINRVSSSRSLLFQNRTLLSNGDFENVLEKFFTDFKKGFLDEYAPRHVTIIGGSRDDLRQTQPLFESYPYIICEETIKCGYTEELSRGNFVVLFFKDLSDATIGKINKVLSSCRTCTILFMFQGLINRNDISFVFNMALEHNVVSSGFAHLGRNFIELYTDFDATNCSMGARSVTVWRPGTSLDDICSWACRTPVMNGCPVSVSSLSFTPKMMIEERENGSLTIVGGREGKLVLTLAKKLNFTVALRYPSVADQLKYSRKLSILNDVASGVSEFGIGRLRTIINDLNDTVAVSASYDEECITWGVPRLMIWSNNIVWVEFTWEVWVAISLLFGISCILGYAHRRNLGRSVVSKNGRRTTPGFMAISLDVVAIHLAIPMVYVSSSPGGRCMLIVYLFYAMVITTAYKTSLASILATDKGTPSIDDAQGIITANLNIGGSLYDYNILQDQVNASKLGKIFLERFVINNDDSETRNKLKSGRRYAYLGRRSLLNWERQMIVKSHGSVAFDVLSECVFAYPTVIAFRNRSFLRKPANDIINHLTESGILNHWDINELDTDEVLERESLERYYDQRAASKFQNIFNLYFFCIAVALLAFFLELTAPMLDSRIRWRATNLVYHN